MLMPSLPNWPGLMNTEMASAYVSLSESAFQGLAARRGVQPVDMGPMRGVRWKRGDLDRLIDNLPLRLDSSRSLASGGACTASDAETAESALSRVMARNTRGR